MEVWDDINTIAKISTIDESMNNDSMVLVHSIGQISAGHLLNVMTSDVEKFQYSGPLVNYLWGAPLETVVILYFGLDLVGVSFLAGFAALMLIIPTQVRESRWRSYLPCRVRGGKTFDKAIRFLRVGLLLHQVGARVDS